MKRRQVKWDQTGSLLWIVVSHPVQFYRYWVESWSRIKAEHLRELERLERQKGDRVR